MILPEDYQQLQSLPDDPKGSVTYGKQTDSAVCIATLFQVSPEEAMDFNGKSDLIEGIHRTLAENQALIEVDAGIRKSGFPYIYSLIKTHTEEGVQYFLLMHLKMPSFIAAVRAFFIESGITGLRDATVYELYSREHPDFNPDEWFYDPYDPELKDCYRMNIAEQEQYDELFPDHPLSQCRRIIRHFKENI